MARVTADLARDEGVSAGLACFGGQGTAHVAAAESDAPCPASRELEDEVERGAGIAGEGLDLVPGVAIDGQGEAVAVAHVELLEGAADDVGLGPAVDLVGGDDEHGEPLSLIRPSRLIEYLIRSRSLMIHMIRPGSLMPSLSGLRPSR